MKLSILLLGSIGLAAAAPSPLFNLDYDLELAIETSNYNPSDQILIDRFAQELKAIDSFNVTNSTQAVTCDKCIKKLQLGKSIALTRPDLVYPIFTKWCIDTKQGSKTSCNIHYGRNTVDNSTYGTNFANMLYLMEPSSYDGQLYCHFLGEKACPLPETPKFDLSGYWPKKQPKHEVAPKPGNETYNVLHISDFHLELAYKIGTEANCSQTMCCTPHSFNEDPVPKGYNFTSNMTDAQISNLSYSPAWYDSDFELQYGDPIDVFNNDSIWYPANTFGSYNCDAPEVLVNSSLKSVAQYQEKLGLDFKFSLFTGDMVDHNEAQYTSYEYVVESEELVLRDLKHTLRDIPIYSVLGNHDTFPYAQIAQEKSGFGNLFNWNADLMADIWEDYEWINATTARYVRKHYAGYAVTTPNNLKIISLDSNAYYYKNLYMYWNATDIDSFGQFQFLIDELIDSEAKDQRVWIISHIPFIQQALPLPAKVFTEIVKRFSPYTIAHIFFAHTHLDQWNMLYDGEVTNKTEENVIADALIVQSVTPWSSNNPGWRYYEIDTKTHMVMESLNYFTRLNETYMNENEEPDWEFEYSARDVYSNVTLWPKDAPLNATFWHRVTANVNSSAEVDQIYNNYKRRFSPATPDCINSDECNGSWCFLASFTLDDYTACMKTFNEPEFY